MKLELNATAVLALVGVAVAGYAAWRLAKAAPAALSAVGAAVNPLNPDNIVATGVNSVGGTLVTDPAGPGKNADGSWTLGGWLYDVTHDEPRYVNGVEAAGW